MSRLRYAAYTAVALSSSLLLVGCKPSANVDSRLSPRLVQVAQVQPAEGMERTYTGVVSARIQSDLGFRVPGKVTERLVDTGQVVKRGQRLMLIDATDYTHAIAVQTGDVDAARAHWTQASADEQRYRGLADTGAISQLTYDQAKAAADSAKALLSAAEAQEMVARNQGDYSILLADADGTVVETLAEPGQVVAAGQPVIRLAHAGPREATVNLPETERPEIGSQAQASVYGGAASISARLRQLSDAADARTRTFEARYVLEGAGASAPLGATVTLHLLGTGSATAAAAQIPLGAIDDEGKGAGIWVVDPKTSEVRFRLVQVSALGEETAIVSDGAHIGEQIVAVGGHYLHESERVKLVNTQVAMQ
jgi:RND family efflux transporter MFP subunit